jgi:mRNA-degrading endonuclease RelE of RelBE toxin-antitoxin system
MSDDEQRENPWQVDFSAKAEKQIGKLPPDIRAIAYLLKGDLEQKGQELSGSKWRNLGKIINARNEIYHCHLNNNRPRYIAIWMVVNREKQIIKIRYAGPHGGVNYSRF